MITIDLSFYWLAVGSICTSLAGMWAFRRVRSLLGR